MDTLPDDVLVLVFLLLDTRQLLRVRAVCRRWRDMALEPWVWRHRQLQALRRLPWPVRDPDDPLDPDFVRAVLSLAPRLTALYLTSDFTLVPSYLIKHTSLSDFDNRRGSVDDSPSNENLNLLATSTKCAVARLVLDVLDVRRAADILRRQVAFGRLREIHVRFLTPIPEGEAGFLDLLGALVYSGAESLIVCRRSQCSDLPVELTDAGESVLRSFHVNPTRTSLRTLVFVDVGTSSHPPSLRAGLARILLTVHAATLEKVSLPSYFLGEVSAQILACFPVMVNLRKLACPLLQDMTLLLQCPCLEEVNLNVEFDDEDTVRDELASAAQFLRQATRLKTFLIRILKSPSSSPALLDLLSAPADSRCSALQSLHITQPPFAEQLPFVPRLAAALPQLSTVRHLTILSMRCMRRLLVAISLALMPSLETLKILTGRIRCPHAWIHQCYVQAALRRNPNLHLLLKPGFRAKECGADAECGYCQAGCHPHLRGRQAAGLFAHARSEHCPRSPHRKGFAWHWVDRRRPPRTCSSENCRVCVPAQ